MSPRLQKIRLDWTDDRLMVLPGVAKAIKETPEITPDDVFGTLVANDPTKTGKFVSWMLKAWEGRDFQWEDIRAGKKSLIHQTMRDFEAYKRMKGADKEFLIDEKHRSVMAHAGPQALWQYMNTIPELKSRMENEGPDTESNRQRKKLMSMKAHMEAWLHEYPSGLKATAPRTLFSSRFFGRNTKWCTTEADGYNFRSYSEDGPLVIFTLPNGMRFQGHYNVESGETTFLNAADLDPTQEEYDALLGYREDIKYAMRSECIEFGELPEFADEAVDNMFTKMSVLLEQKETRKKKAQLMKGQGLQPWTRTPLFVKRMIVSNQ